MSIQDKVFFALVIDFNENTQQYQNELMKLEQCQFLFSDSYTDQVEHIKQKKYDAIFINIKLLTEQQQPELNMVKKQFKEYNIPTFFFRFRTGQEISIELILNTSIAPPDTLLLSELVTSIKERSLSPVQVEPQKTSEKADKQTDLLDSQEFNQLKAVFIRNITYEIRTLLNNVGGPMQLIKEKIDDPELIPFFSIIDTTLNRLVEFTFKATLSSDLKLGNYPIKKKLINLDEIFKFSVLELTEFFEMENIKLTVHPAHSAVSLYGDKDLLFHSFTAILDKVINLTKENGEISVDFGAGQDTIDCLISTNGISFKRQDVLEIFNSASIEQEIGLVLAKKVLEIHNGFYWVDFSKETGVTLGISFKTSAHE